MASTFSTSSTSSTFSTCLGCGCVCDDIQLHVEDNRIVDARNACALGVQWFGDGRLPSRATIRGHEATVDEALKAGAEALRDASRALVFLAPDVSCETQRASIAVADRLRAAIDSITSSTTRAALLATQEAGRASATLGEIRNRADVVVFWGVDPARRYPRFWTRYAPEPAGLFVGGRTDRTVVAVDVGDRHGPVDADTRVALVPDREVSTVMEWTAAVAGPPARQPSGAPILDTLLLGKYVAIVVDAEPDEGNDARDNGLTAALLAFAQALNGATRCALISLRAGGNRSGADACLTTQTGYPMAVDFSCGYPRYRPHDDGGTRMSRGAIDAMLVVGSAASAPRVLLDAIARIPTVVIGPRATDSPVPAHVAIDTGVVGIHESGTALRLDDVPLPLTGAITGPPATLDVLVGLAGRL